MAAVGVGRRWEINSFAANPGLAIGPRTVGLGGLLRRGRLLIALGLRLVLGLGLWLVLRLRWVLGLVLLRRGLLPRLRPLLVGRLLGGRLLTLLAVVELLRRTASLALDTLAHLIAAALADAAVAMPKEATDAP